MITVRPFQPFADTASVAVGTTTAAFLIPGLPRGTCSVRVANSSAGLVYLGFGESAAQASAAATVAIGMPMLPNTVETFQIRAGTTHVAIIGAEVTGKLHVTAGESA
jgi:hypothetical protein